MVSLFNQCGGYKIETSIPIDFIDMIFALEIESETENHFDMSFNSNSKISINGDQIKQYGLIQSLNPYVGPENDRYSRPKVDKNINITLRRKMQEAKQDTLIKNAQDLRVSKRQQSIDVRALQEQNQSLSYQEKTQIKRIQANKILLQSYGCLSNKIKYQRLYSRSIDYILVQPCETASVIQMSSALNIVHRQSNNIIALNSMYPQQNSIQKKPEGRSVYQTPKTNIYNFDLLQNNINRYELNRTKINERSYSYREQNPVFQGMKKSKVSANSLLSQSVDESNHAVTNKHNKPDFETQRYHASQDKHKLPQVGYMCKLTSKSVLRPVNSFI